MEGTMAINAAGWIQHASSQSGYRPIIDEETGQIKTDDPKLTTQKMLLDKVFGYGDEENESTVKPFDRTSAPQPPQAPDTVVLSAESIELYNSTKAQFTYNNGGERLQITVEQQEFVRIEQQQQVQSSDPLVIDLDNDGIELTDVRSGKGVLFDITGDGKQEMVSWVQPDDGLLVYDANGNGSIDNGKELFGDQNGAINGFAELAKYDIDNNGAIDKTDTIFDQLRIWTDRDSDGISSTGELHSLSSLGISSISLSARSVNEYIAGNSICAYADYCGTNTGTVGEAHFNYLA
jgi:hypothetical protein